MSISIYQFILSPLWYPYTCYISGSPFPPCKSEPFHLYRFICAIFLILSVQSLSHVRLFATPWIAARRSSFIIPSICLFLLFMGSQGKNSEVACHSLLQWTAFCQTSPPWPVRLGWPHTAWLSFIELDTTVALWSDWLVFCDYGFSVSALWCPLTPTVLLGSLLPWTWGISSRLLQQSAAAAPYLDKGYLLTAAPPDLECGVAPLSPPAPI